MYIVTPVLHLAPCAFMFVRFSFVRGVRSFMNDLVTSLFLYVGVAAFFLSVCFFLYILRSFYI